MAKRIEYIDALRGFTMILVVLNHVTSYGYGDYQSLLNTIFVSFRMPLFFFISGFIVYKANEKWSLCTLHDKIVKKVRVQIIPTLFFGLFYTYFVLTMKIGDFFENLHKFGYWFGIALLEMFIIYYVVSFFSNRIALKNKHLERNKIYLLCGVSIVMLVLKFPLKENPILSDIGNITCVHLTFQYFQFFVFGVISSQFKAKFHKLISNQYVSFVVLFFFIIALIIRLNFIEPTIGTPDNARGFIEKCINILGGYLGIILVYGCFYKYQIFVMSETKIGKLLQYIGKRTFDIYLLHFFIIPRLPEIGKYLSSYPNIVLEICIGLIISMLVIVCCLLISGFLCYSEFVAYWLFGKKRV